MRNNTQRIYERLSRGEFLSVDSTDTSTRHLYEDILGDKYMSSKIARRPRYPVLLQLTHPFPFMNVAFSAISGVMRAARSSASLGV